MIQECGTSVIVYYCFNGKTAKLAATMGLQLLTLKQDTCF
jgi:hypothetical protein